MPTFLFVKKAYVEMECTLTMEIYIVKYIWLLCRYFWECTHTNTERARETSYGKMH